MQYTLEEAELTQHSNGQELQPEISEPTSTTTPEPETEQEITTIVPITTEPEVIDGEVIEIEPPEPAEDHTPPKQKPYWLLIPLTILFCLLFVAASSLLPFLTPSATVTIIPVERTITTLAAIQVQGRQLAPLTLMQSMSVATTGKKHQDATRAEGTITLYNGLILRQTIAAGTMLTGSDGVQVVTDQAAVIPAANPPIEGQVTVPAHTLVAGQQGNIQAYDINTACCVTSVVAKNTQAFTGGASARDFLVVTRADINTAVTSLLVTLSQSEVAALQAQLHPGEELITPSCDPTVSSTHKIGDEAKEVAVTVSVTCSGMAYLAHKVHANATQLIQSQANKTLGSDYRLMGDIQVSIVHATISNPRQGIANIVVQVTGTWVYQITPEIQQHLLHLIAGMSKQQALQTLLQFPGIQGAQIIVKGGNRTLPQDPRNIHIVILYAS